MGPIHAVVGSAMNFLLILLALAVELMIYSSESWRSAKWSNDWIVWLGRVLGRFRWWQGAWGAALALALPALGTGMFFAIVSGWSALLGVLASVVCLLLMLGPGDLNREVEAHKRRVDLAEAGDGETTAITFLDHPEELGDLMPGSAQDPDHVELAAIAAAADSRWFGPLFWFFCLGPVGAVLYRLCSNVRPGDTCGDDFARAWDFCGELLRWIPSRITVLGMGFAGTLVPVLDVANEHGLLRWGPSRALVGAAAVAAIDHGRIEHVSGADPRIFLINAIHALVKRTLSVWLVVLAGLALLVY